MLRKNETRPGRQAQGRIKTDNDIVPQPTRGESIAMLTVASAIIAAMVWDAAGCLYGIVAFALMMLAVAVADRAFGGDWG